MGPLEDNIRALLSDDDEGPPAPAKLDLAAMMAQTATDPDAAAREEPRTTASASASVPSRARRASIRKKTLSLPGPVTRQGEGVRARVPFEATEEFVTYLAELSRVSATTLVLSALQTFGPGLRAKAKSRVMIPAYEREVGGMRKRWTLLLTTAEVKALDDLVEVVGPVLSVPPSRAEVISQCLSATLEGRARETG